MLPPPQPPSPPFAQDDSLTTTLAAAIGAVATIASTSTTMPPAATAAVADGSPTEDEYTGECRLLGSFALLVQAALGGLALLSLVYKRWKERPQRPVKVWFFDVSKQVFGSVLVHIANVFMSMLTSGRFSVMDPSPPHKAVLAMLMIRSDEPYVPNPCSFYLLNLGIDTTLGIPILIGLLHLTTKIVSYTPVGQPPESIQSGWYGNPPNAWWWLKQSIIYFCGLFGMKIVVLIIFLVFPWLSRVGDWALGWTEGNEKLQIIFVMMLFPLIMNAMQYYIIDSFIKKKTDHEPLYDHHSGHDDHHHHGGAYQRAVTDSDSESDSGAESDVDDVRMHHSAIMNHPERREYDPTRDGDSQTIIGSTASSGSNQQDTVKGTERDVISKGLYPHE